MKDEALKTALEYMNERLEDHDSKFMRHPATEAERDIILANIKEVKEALAQPAQEPVAWTLLLTSEHHGIIGEAGEKFIGAPECYQRVNVYTTPLKRPWVGLTDEETETLIHRFDGDSHTLLDEVNARLKEKNT
jgi:hypothetical protein